MYRIAAAALLTLALAAPASSAAPKDYRLDLVANPTAPFPFLKKFGSIDISLYPGGVAAKSLFLRGFSRNGEPTVTIVNPLGRMYASLPLSKLRDTFVSLSGRKGEIMPGLGDFPITKIGNGRVKSLPATRYRVQLGPESSMDVWTTAAIPKHAQFEALYLQAVDAVSHAAVRTIRKIPGTPVYIEMNTLNHRKLALLTVKEMKPSSEGADDALTVGSFYVKAPILEKLLD